MANIEKREGYINELREVPTAEGTQIFGYVSPEDGSKKLFIKQINGKPFENSVELHKLTVGTRVQFKTIGSPKGPFADIIEIEKDEEKNNN